ncbi:hypothetical protein GGI25_006391 [Coemansia spiralis]|uniref:Glutamine amidotransferase type-2 domain-containing protein n=2 Tax=Coemansia TaxID=4863 RepID=A0A9W8G1E9_9FUNG|nr:hypothetical protein EDC05_006371 [Coemansia umbellata]KAJ2618656.1 hypothetical protein GGI26_006440 [Coemansia sp. RSA 1358]KAJ2668669.1 hypothetical protein GGI25_006391 [Coemansia spiralis]
MCGIQVLIWLASSSQQHTDYQVCCSGQTWDNLTLANRHRGPDSHNELTVALVDSNSGDTSDYAYAQQNIVIKFGAHVLHLRGLETQSQPIVDKESKDVLCWNGEVFGGLDIGSNNDGLLLFEKIQQTKQEDPATYILRVFKNIEGPYAFVYLDYKQRKLWFARDFLGRRSLLTKRAGKHSLLISSVADSVSSAAEEQNTSYHALFSANWTEVPAQQIYCLDLAALAVAPAFTDNSLVKYSWKYSTSDTGGNNNSKIDHSAELVLPFDQVTLNLAEHCLPAQAAESISDLADFPKTAQWQPYINQLKAVLMQAIRTRVEYIPFNHSSTETSSQPRVGILFSGGVDCITIAALLTKILPKTEPIELFNVAFENPRQAKAHKPLDLSKSNIYDVPDRKTGRQGWQELCQLDPERDWRFVEVDVPYSLVVENKTNIRQLLVPSDTIMDMSIGLALWFASKGEGYLVNKDASNRLGYSRQPYTGVARVLLLGMGADEQLGGYSRHRAAWERGGWQELGQEIRLDVQRISTRNLGRDDRMVSDNSKESRYPFIAAEVVKFLSETPLDRKMDMHYPRGIGEKLLLRLLAHQLGLLQACMLAKRAIQFGARTAKMESSQTKGQDVL